MQLAVLPFATQCCGGMHVWVATNIVRSALQVSTVSPLQRESPAAHVGAMHIAVDGTQSAAVAQAAPLCHVPATHVCGTLPTHCMFPGTHSPPQAPLTQTNVHAELLTHCPDALHV
jgi:hypothetical protein